MTAIHLAARSNHIQVTQCLLECILSVPRKISPDIIDSMDEDGCTAFSHAAGKGHVDILRLLVPHADTDQMDFEGRTPLHIASCEGHTEVVRYLLDLPIESRPDVNAMDGYGTTPLQYANGSWNSDCIKLLLEHGALEGHLEPSDADSDSMSDSEDST